MKSCKVAKSVAIGLWVQSTHLSSGFKWSTSASEQFFILNQTNLNGNVQRPEINLNPLMENTIKLNFRGGNEKREKN